MSGHLNMGNESGYQEITSETKALAVSGIQSADFVWDEGEDFQEFRYRPFSIRCADTTTLKVILWGDRPLINGEHQGSQVPNLADNSKAVIMHFLEGPDTPRLFKIVGDAGNTSDGGVAGEITAHI